VLTRVRDRKGAPNGPPPICSTTSASPGQSTYHLSSLLAPNFVIARALSFISDFRRTPFGLPNHNSRGFRDESLRTSLYIVLRTFDCSVVPGGSHWAYLNPVPTRMRAEVFLPLGNSRFHPSPASVQTVLLISFPSSRLAKFPRSASNISLTTDSNPTTQLPGRPSFHTSILRGTATPQEAPQQYRSPTPGHKPRPHPGSSRDGQGHSSDH